MKNKNLSAFASLIAAGFFLAGCQDKNDASDNTPTNRVHDLTNNTSRVVTSNVDQTVNSVSNATTDAVNQTTNAIGNAVDNSKINERDRDTNNLTPLDQGNSDADRMMSASIRKMVVSGTNNYSMTAKNIKIITKDGKVTLRGPVKTDDEKSGIEAIAKGVAGDGNVDDQLEVKNNQ